MGVKGLPGEKMLIYSKYIPNNVYTHEDLPNIFEIKFEDQENNDKLMKLSLQIQSATYTDNLLIIKFVTYDYLIGENEKREVITNEDIKNIFSKKQKIILSVGNRSGEIIRKYIFNDCVFKYLAKEIYDYNLTLNQNKVQILILNYKSKNTT